MLPRITIIFALLAAVPMPSHADAASFPIPPDSIRDAVIMGLGDKLSGAISPVENIQIPSRPRARTQNPTLLSESLERAFDRRMFHLRIRCQPITDCVPFLVEVRFSAEVTDGLQSALQKSALNARAPIIVRAGSHPSLRVSRGDVHISMPVRALQAGRIGQRIRVCSDETGRVYWARVLDSKHVEGSD